MLYEKDLRKYEKWLKIKANVSDSVDYTYKGTIISNKINQFVNKLTWHEHLNRVYNAFGISTYYEYTDDSIDIMYNSLADKFGFCSILESIRVNDAKKHKVSRLRDRVESIISYNSSLFVTLTFTDKVLSSTSDKTRRRYVVRFLKKYTLNYVANVDFGARNHREHYHAVILADKIDHKAWPYGAINFKRIHYDCDKDTINKLSLYVAKLTNHAIKETCKRCYLIYPKIKR